MILHPLWLRFTAEQLEEQYHEWQAPQEHAWDRTAYTVHIMVFVALQATLLAMYPRAVINSIWCVVLFSSLLALQGPTFRLPTERYRALRNRIFILLRIGFLIACAFGNPHWTSISVVPSQSVVRPLIINNAWFYQFFSALTLKLPIKQHLILQMSASLLFNLIENEGACDLQYERGGLPFVKASLRLIQPLTLVNAVPSGGTSLIAAAVWPPVDSAFRGAAADKAVNRPKLILQDWWDTAAHASLRTCPSTNGLRSTYMCAVGNGTGGLGDALAAACSMAGVTAPEALRSCQLTAGDPAAAAAAAAAESAGRLAAAHPPVTVCPCWVVAAFVSVLLGLGLTTLVVYGLEWRSRRRFLELVRHESFAQLQPPGQGWLVAPPALQQWELTGEGPLAVPCRVVLLLLIMLAWWEMMVGVHLLREHWPLVRAGT